MEFFSREIRAARRRSALDADDHRQPDRHVHRPAARAGRARSLLHALARHALHRRLRRLLQARQSGLGTDAGLERSRAAVAALHGLRPSRRSRGDDRRSAKAERPGRRAHLLREPLLPQGRHAALADVDVDAVSANSRSSTPPRATSPSARPPRKRWPATRASSSRASASSRIRPRARRSSSRSWRSPSAAPRRRPRPRARSSPT